MCKISDALTSSTTLWPPRANEKDQVKLLIDNTKKVLEKGTDSEKTKSAATLKIRSIPLVDMNMLMMLIEHYECAKDPQWKLFKQQTNEKFRNAGREE